MQHLSYVLLPVVTLFLFASPAAQAQESSSGASTFAQKCSACHTIGKGNLVGPDLSKVMSWSDSDLTSSVKRMENMVGPLTDVQVKDLVTFLKQTDAAKRLENKQEEVEQKAVLEDQKEPASAALGKELFFGKQPLKNGGMSCVACHSSTGSGANLAPDLTDIGQRLTETALISASENASFKVMKGAYAKHPITHEEARNLAKYFESTKNTPLGAAKGPEHAWLAGTGIAGVVLSLIGFGFRNRNSEVRRKLRRR